MPVINDVGQKHNLFGVRADQPDVGIKSVVLVSAGFVKPDFVFFNKCSSV